MKHSHMVTPRTMRDGDWSAWGDPIERHIDRSAYWADICMAIIFVSVLAALALGAI